MEIITDRLILRPWQESDAKNLYEYAKNPVVGPIAGWPIHTSIENSRQIINTVLSAQETYAVCLKFDNKAIGSIGLMIGKASTLDLPDDEGEIGYWVGEPFWGQGLIPEAAKTLLRHGFEELKLKKIWCAYFDGNFKSKRAQEKCGFIYHHTNTDILWELMDYIRTEHITCLTKEDWKNNRKTIEKQQLNYEQLCNDKNSISILTSDELQFSCKLNNVDTDNIDVKCERGLLLI